MRFVVVVTVSDMVPNRTAKKVIVGGQALSYFIGNNRLLMRAINHLVSMVALFGVGLQHCVLCGVALANGRSFLR